MQEIFQYIIIALLSASIILSFFNTLEIRKIKRVFNFQYTDEMKDLYFQLKLRVQFITAIVSVVVTIVVFFGFNAQKKVEESIKEGVTQEFGKYDSLYKKYDLQVTALSVYISDMQNQSNTVSKDVGTAANRISELQKQLKAIKEKKFLNKEIAIIQNLPISYVDLDKSANTDYKDKVIIYFKDQTTIEGEKLPPFKNIPVLNFTTRNGGLQIVKVTNEYFEVVWGLSSMIEDEGIKNKNVYMDLWIFY